MKKINVKHADLRKNTIIFAISSFGTKFLSFLLVPLYTNVLSTAEYGAVDLITTTGTLLIFVLTINIADAVLRFAIERSENQNEILSYGVRVLLVGTLCCAALLGMVYYAGWFEWPTYYFPFMLLYFSSTAFYQILTSYLRGIGKVKQVAVAGIVSSAAMIAGNILFLLIIRIGVLGYLLSLILGPVIASVYCVFVIGEPLRVYVKDYSDRVTRLAMCRYCIPLIFNNIALWINAFLDRYFVVGYCGVAENGIYSVANKIPMILATCYTVFSQAWNLSAIKEFDPEDQDGFFSQTYSSYNALITLVCSGLILINIPLAKFLYANDFFQAWQYSSVLLLSVMFNSLTIFVGSIFSAVKKTKTIAVTTILSAVTNTILNAILIPVFGALGAAIATVVAYVVMWFTRIIFSRKFIKMRIHLLKDCCVYALLTLQVVCEHMEAHFYVGQFLCIGAILFVYRGYIGDIIKRFSKRMHKKQGAQ